MFKQLFIPSLIFFLSSTSFGQVVAQAGTDSITQKEFNESYKVAVQNSRQTGRVPTKKEHLEDMIRFKIGLQEARNTKLKKNPIVKKALELELYKGLIETRLAKSVERIKVTEAEMRNYYKKTPNLRSSHILISFPFNASESEINEARRRANKIYAQVLSKKRKWEVDVRAFSDDTQTKTFGGDIGYHNNNSINPSYYKALKSLKMGQISKPVQGVFGFHIIKKTGVQSYDMANKNPIKIAVFDEKRFRIFDTYFSKLKKKYKVTIKKEKL